MLWIQLFFFWSLDMATNQGDGKFRIETLFKPIMRWDPPGYFCYMTSTPTTNHICCDMIYTRISIETIYLVYLSHSQYLLRLYMACKMVIILNKGWRVIFIEFQDNYSYLRIFLSFIYKWPFLCLHRVWRAEDIFWWSNDRIVKCATDIPNNSNQVLNWEVFPDWSAQSAGAMKYADCPSTEE